MIIEDSPLYAERRHLSELLEAIQRCIYFLNASSQKLTWPLSIEILEAQKKNTELFESLAAINERFAKLQDTLAAAMRHAYILSGEPSDRFLKVLCFYEKINVIESLENWQLCRATRNLAPHDYEVDYEDIAEHFNALHSLTPELYRTASRFLDYCNEALAIQPKHSDFSDDFNSIVNIS